MTSSHDADANDERPLSFGSLRRLTPVSKQWGFDRGTPIDRYYIESFLDRHSDSIQGRVLEVKDRSYTERFGNGKVSESEILDIDSANREATLVADVTQDDGLPADRFDCVIFTQTLQFVSSPERALRNLSRMLRPRGALLLTCPGITRIQTKGTESNWYWSFFPLGIQMLLEREFEASSIRVTSHGNVLAATCFLWGLAAEEIERSELDFCDPAYPLLITAHARRPG